MSMEELQSLAGIIQDLGMWIFGFILFFKERSDHNETRRLYNDDLRGAAGLRPRFRPTTDDDPPKPTTVP